jgi:hypothetical protein
MALGDQSKFQNSNGSGDSNKIYEKTYNSRLVTRDYQHEVGSKTPKLLNYKFKSGMLIISIDRVKEGGFESETIVDSWITMSKATLLLDAIEAYKKDPKGYYGIASGMSTTQRALIVHSDEDGKPAVTIGKFDGTNGQWQAKETFRFNNNDFHFYLSWKDPEDNSSAKKLYNNDLEFDQFVKIVQDFASNMNGVVAYSVADMLKADFRGVLNKMNPIYDKLGIERNFSSRNNTGSFFGSNNFGNGGASRKSFGDISSNFEDED